MTSEGEDFTMYQGEYVLLTVTVASKDISGSTPINWVMTPRISAPTPSVAKSLAAAEIVITDGPGGIFTIALDAADTENLAPGQYIHQARVVDAAGKPITTTAGTITLLASAI